MLAVHVGHIALSKLSTRDLDETYAKLMARGGKPKRKGEKLGRSRRARCCTFTALSIPALSRRANGS